MILRALTLSLLLPATSFAAQPKWFVLTREQGCQPLSELYADIPYLKNRSTPQSLYAEVRRHHPDATLRPFLDALTKEGPPESQDEKEFFSFFTKSNAYILESKEGEIGFPLVLEQICRSMGGLPKR